MANKKILDEEILSDEQLEQVAGGTLHEQEVDKKLFAALGYGDMLVMDVWLAHGITFRSYNDSKNRYFSGMGFLECSHLEAIGELLYQENYPGFRANHPGLFFVKADESYVKDFLFRKFNICY